MKGLIIPAILISTILIVGFFAFSSVEKASSVDSIIASNDSGGFVTTTKSIPDGSPGAATSWTFSANEDAIITSIWITIEDPVTLTAFDIGAFDFEFSDQVLPLDIDDETDPEILDLRYLWFDNLNDDEGWSDHIPLETGDNLVLTFTDDSAANGTNDVTVWITFQRGDGATLV